ncbi:hypothetical protein DUP91_29430, partial [Salmonella enterica subsp. enterica]|nr:hypothetical protein [Salmonella enterica subsp. enterica]
FKRAVSTSLRRHRGSETLRTTHILASLHASLRWNKQQKLKGNDLWDFRHATAALAYCDAFFTEKPLKNMVTQSHVALDKLYDCRVIASVEDAVEWVAGITSPYSPPPATAPGYPPDTR